MANATKPERPINEESFYKPKDFEYGDFYLKCHNCGYEKLMFESVKNGVQFSIMTREDACMDVKCDKCNVHLSFFFKEGKSPEEIVSYDSATDESIIEDATDEEPVLQEDQI